jgi:hypothetical protein
MLKTNVNGVGPRTFYTAEKKADCPSCSEGYFTCFFFFLYVVHKQLLHGMCMFGGTGNEIKFMIRELQEYLCLKFLRLRHLNSSKLLNVLFISPHRKENVSSPYAFS